MSAAPCEKRVGSARGAPWSDLGEKTSPEYHQQSFEEEAKDKLSPPTSSLGPIGPPSKWVEGLRLECCDFKSAVLVRLEECDNKVALVFGLLLLLHNVCCKGLYRACADISVFFMCSYCYSAYLPTCRLTKSASAAPLGGSVKSTPRSYSPGSRPKTSPAGVSASPQRAELSPAAKSPLLGPAPPGLLPPPEKGERAK